MEQVEERPALHDDEVDGVREDLLAASEAPTVDVALHAQHVPLAILVPFVLIRVHDRRLWPQDQLPAVVAPRPERQRALLSTARTRQYHS